MAIAHGSTVMEHTRYSTSLVWPSRASLSACFSLLTSLVDVLADLAVHTGVTGHGSEWSSCHEGDSTAGPYARCSCVTLQMDSLLWNVWHAPVDDASFTLPHLSSLYFPFCLIMSDQPLAIFYCFLPADVRGNESEMHCQSKRGSLWGGEKCNRALGCTVNRFDVSSTWLALLFLTPVTGSFYGLAASSTELCVIDWFAKVWCSQDAHLMSILVALSPVSCLSFLQALVIDCLIFDFLATRKSFTDYYMLYMMLLI